MFESPSALGITTLQYRSELDEGRESLPVLAEAWFRLLRRFPVLLEGLREFLFELSVLDMFCAGYYGARENSRERDAEEATGVRRGAY